MGLFLELFERAMKGLAMLVKYYGDIIKRSMRDCVVTYTISMCQAFMHIYQMMS